MKTKPDYHIETLVLGQMSTNCYLIMDKKTHDAVIIDPADEGGFIAEKIAQIGAVPRAIVATHGHFDHVLGGFELQHIFSLPFYMNPEDNFLLKRMGQTADYFLGHTVVEPPPTPTSIAKKTLTAGSIAFDIIPTPGHTLGSISLCIPDLGIIFSGDTLFANGGVGRTDLSYSKPADLVISIKRLFKLPEPFVVYPGHGDSTTIGQEKKIWKEYHI